MADALNERLNMWRQVDGFLRQQPALTSTDVTVVVEAAKRFYTNLLVYYPKEVTDFDKVIDCLKLGWTWWLQEKAEGRTVDINNISKAFNLSNPPMAWLTALRTP